MTTLDTLQRELDTAGKAVDARLERDRQTIERLVAALKERSGISTEYRAKPIPHRGFDWVATYGDYDGMGSPIGYGRSEAEAVLDLVGQ